MINATLKRVDLGQKNLPDSKITDKQLHKMVLGGNTWS